MARPSKGSDEEKSTNGANLGIEGKLCIDAYAGVMHNIVPYIQAGGSLFQPDAKGDTILHAAAAGWQHRMVEFLLLSGADADVQNTDGDTPLHTIVRSRDIPFEGRFLRHISPEDARRETFRMLFGHGASTSILNIQGANALHIAAHEGDLIAIDELVIADRMKCIDAPTSKGATALVLAIVQGHAACAKRLIAFGADIHLRMLDDITPLGMLYSSDNPELRALVGE